MTGSISKHFKWKRSVCPWDLKRSHNEWEEIVRVEHTNESLKAHVNRVKRIYGHERSPRAGVVQMNTRNKETNVQPAATAAAQQQQSMGAAEAVAPRLPVIHLDVAAAHAGTGVGATDPSIAAELRQLKIALPVMAAAAAATTDDPSLLPPPLLSPMAESDAADPPPSLTFDPSTEDAHTPVASVPAVTQGATRAAAATPASAAPVWRPPHGWPFLSAHPRVLVLTKTPRYEHEKNSTGLQGADLHAQLSQLGFVADRLVQSYVRHMEGLAQLTLALQQHSMRVTVKQVDQATHKDLEGVDLLVSAGGDGTMLKAAALLGFHQSAALAEASAAAATAASDGAPSPPHTDNSSDDQPLSGSVHPAAPVGAPSEASTGAGAVGSSSAPFIPIPLIGVNTDPQHSSGVLCAFSIEGAHTAERVIDHLKKSHFVWLAKSRIEITLIDNFGVSSQVGQYAYNDVVVAERDPGRPIVVELRVDEHPPEIQRSSGVLVCTGTGSTAWMSNAAGRHRHIWEPAQ